MPNKKTYYYIVIISIVFLLNGCKYWHSNVGWARPASIVTELDYGPEIYRQGYKEGCSSGYSGYANNFNKMFWKWQQDTKLVTNTMYYRVWRDAYNYCAFAAMTHDEHGMGNWR